MTKATQLQRRAVASDFATQNPILDAGEFAFEKDTRIYKIGDGVTRWLDLQTHYIPLNIMTKKGDLVVMGPVLVQGLQNPNLSVDSNNDGIADGWTVEGDPAYLSMVSGSQQVRSAPSQTNAITQVVTIIAGHTYRVSGKYIFNFLGDGAHQLIFAVEWYTDASLTTQVGSNNVTIDGGEPYEPSDWFLLDTAPAGATRAKIILQALGGASVLFTGISMHDTSTFGYTRLEAGNPNQILSVNLDGYLQWTENAVGDAASYITSAQMASHFIRIVDADSFHSSMLTLTAADAYETQENAAIAHALHQYAAAAATDYHTPASVAGLFEDLDLIAVKAADQTVTNSATQVNVTDLSFPMAANGVYIFELFLLVSGTAANSMKVSLVATTCLTNIWGIHGEAIAGGVATGTMDMAVSTGNPTTPGAQQLGLDGTTVTLVTIRGAIFNGTSAGTAQLTFAQNTAASSTSCTIKKDSYLRALRAS